MTFADVTDLDLCAELVVLSACHAGLDRILSGDEQLGLGRGLLQAGASTLITTLWAVRDNAIARWMSDFYRDFLAGAEPAEAHRAASLRARERDPHPHAWAATILTGKPVRGPRPEVVL